MSSCINTLNDHQSFYGTPPPASPRISFSSDLVADAKPPPRDIVTPDPTFEFAVGVRPMISADELFFKGRMVPLSTGPSAMVTTLRDELGALQNGGEGGQQPRGFVRWKEFLGLKRASSAQSARKNDNSDNSSAAADVAGEMCRKNHAGSAKKEL
ncbi:uncharacterized protein LOC110026346 [Phalaenopsis equestris]|uniref:uncharacterized protein LOC110026346 n=1 Tax=Phalaenopsis equestris TaxID=78828 RepID=UPI0009E40B17|nr:uncharacterized protein LOC110026346 [Phalaenopsis equestris]